MDFTNHLQNKEESSPGTLNHNTISRFIKGSNGSLSIKNRNILAQYSKREYDKSINFKQNWLEAIKNLFMNMNVSEEIKKNTIPDIISYTKSYVKNCVMNDSDLCEFLNVLEGTNFNISALIEIIKEANYIN